MEDHVSGKRKIRDGLALLGRIASALSKPGAVGLITAPVHGFELIEEGEKILTQLPMQDPFEKAVMKIVLDAAHKTMQVTGGGGYLTIFFSEAIYAEGETFLRGGGDPIALKKILEDDAHKVQSKINEFASSFQSKEKSILDEEIRFDVGYLSPYFMTEGESKRCVLKNPRVYLTDQKLESALDVARILKVSQDEPLLIIALSIEDEALETLLMNKLKGKRSLGAVVTSSSKMLEEIRALSGATLSRRVDEIDRTHFGSLQEVQIGFRGMIINSSSKSTSFDLIEPMIGDLGKVFAETKLLRRLQSQISSESISAKVLSEALRNAVSITKLLLLSEVVVS